MMRAWFASCAWAFVAFAATASSFAAARAESPAERTARFATDFEPGDGIVLLPSHKDPERAVIRRALFAIDDDYAKRWREKKSSEYRLRPEQILVARYRLASGEAPRLFVMVNQRVECAWNFCRVLVFKRDGKNWVPDFELGGWLSEGQGYVPILAQPIEGRYYDYSTSKDSELMVIEPYNNGRPVFIWRYDGLVWDGRDWSTFCWHRCGENG